MYVNSSLWLSLALICWRIAGVRSQSCDSDSECNNGKCCATRNCAETLAVVGTAQGQKYITYCKCQADSDCSPWERCSEMSCELRDSVTSAVPYLSSLATKTHEPFTYYRKECVEDSDCGGTETCKDGKCVLKLDDGDSYWIIAPVLIFFVFGVVCVFYVAYRQKQRFRNFPRFKINRSGQIVECNLSRQRNRETGTSAGNMNTLNLFDPNLIAARLSLVPGVQRTSSAQPSTERQQGPVVATSSSAVIEIGNDNNPCSSARSTGIRAPSVYSNENLPREPPPSYNEVAKKSPLDCLD